LFFTDARHSDGTELLPHPGLQKYIFPEMKKEKNSQAENLTAERCFKKEQSRNIEYRF